MRGILSNAGWLLADRVIRAGGMFAIGIYLARYLGPEQFGSYSFAIAYASLFVSFATLGIEQVVIREFVRQPTKSSVLLGSVFMLRALGAGIGLLVALWSIYWLDLIPSDRASGATLACLSILFAPLLIIDSWFLALGSGRFSAYARLSSFLVVVCLYIFFLLRGASTNEVIAITVVEAALTSLLFLALYASKEGMPWNWRFKWSEIRDVLKQAWPLMVAAMAIHAYMKIDVVMLTQLAGTYEAGVYSAAVRISEALHVIPAIALVSVLPITIKLRSAEPRKFREHIENVYRITGMLSISVSFVLSVSAWFIVPYIYGAAYEDGVAILAIHSWTVVAAALGVASGQYLLAENLLIISMLRTVLSLLLCVFLNFFLIPKWGAVGAAISTLCSYFCVPLSMFLFSTTRSQAVALLRGLNPFTWRYIRPVDLS